MRTLALALLAAMVATGALSACEANEGDARAPEEVDPGPTYGVEISVTVRGRGRVSTEPGAVDCPGTCFARVLLENEGVDGAAEGVALLAEASQGAHFKGWSFEAVELGIRARGPSRCSPMRRMSLLPSVSALSPRITLPYAETAGSAPEGLETECAAFTAVPAAYVVTATFEDDVIDTPELLFPAPAAGTVSGKEIGLAGGSLYWRFERNGRSGVASGLADGGGLAVIVAPTESITGFHVDRNAVYQFASGAIEAVPAGSTTPRRIPTAPACAALASDLDNVYCRTAGSSPSSYLYRWSLAPSVGAGALVHTLPRGADLAVDPQRIYFSDDQTGVDAGAASVQSAPRIGNGNAPPVLQLVTGQTSPRGLVVGPSYLFWLDFRTGGTFLASAAPRTGGTAQIRVASPSARFVAADPSSSSFYVGLAGSGAGASSIVRASAISSATAPFRTNLTGLGGLTVSTTHVYWTESDGRVYRARK